MSIPNPVLNLDLSVDTATGSTTARTLADRAADVVNAKDYGVVADGVTDDTVALQAAINAAQASGAAFVQTPGRKVLLPRGRILITGITITAPVTIEGHGKWGTIIVLKAGSTAPAISVSLATTAFASTSGFASVSLRDFQISSPSRADGPGQGVAHGLSLLKPSSSQTVAVVLNRVLVNGVPGDGIHSPGLSGFVEATDCEIAYPGGYGLFANSVFDWIWTGGNIYGAVRDNVLLSGATNFRFDRLNVFSGAKTNFNLFNSDLVVGNSMLDTAGTDGIYVNNVTGSRVDFVGCTFRWASANVNATYSDLQITAGNTGNVYLTNCIFRTPASSPNTNKPLDNIHLQGGNTGLIYIDATSFDLGAITVAGVTNQTSSIVPAIEGLSIGSKTPAAGTFNILTMKNATQFAPFTINNGINNIVRMYGTTANNDSGVLAVASGGTDIVQLSAGNGIGSYINSPVGLSVGTAFTVTGSSTLAATTVTQLNLTTSAGPNIRSGTGAASGTQPKGSLWMRTDGGVGTTMYVSQGAGTWNPVAGV